MKKKFKKVGILGGLGPESTLDFYQKLLLCTPASRDQDHIPSIIYNNPQIPDRTEAIINNKEDPYPYLLDSCKKLEKWGAEFIVIPCNTAHYYIKRIEKNLSIPIINMIEETINFIETNYPWVNRIGLLATTGTLSSGVYTKLLKAKGYDVIVPDKTIQETCVMNAVYGTKGIKAGFKNEPVYLLTYALNNLIEKGAELVIKGCTEIGMVLEQESSPVILVDPNIILARACVRNAIYNKEQKKSSLFIKKISLSAKTFTNPINTIKKNFVDIFSSRRM